MRARLKDKVFNQISLDDLKSENGPSTLINFLDQYLSKDDLADSLEKIDDFDDFKRKEGQSIHKFIVMFDSKYKKIEKKNMALPPEILAFKLLKKVNWFVLRFYSPVIMEIDHEIFSMVILSLPLIQEGQLSISGKRMCTILVIHLED